MYLCIALVILTLFPITGVFIYSCWSMLPSRVISLIQYSSAPYHRLGVIGKYVTFLYIIYIWFFLNWLREERKEICIYTVLYNAIITFTSAFCFFVRIWNTVWVTCFQLILSYKVGPLATNSLRLCWSKKIALRNIGFLVDGFLFLFWHFEYVFILPSALHCFWWQVRG